MIATRTPEIVDEFKAIQSATICGLERIADDTDLPGLDLDSLIRFAEIAEPAFFVNKRMLDARGSIDSSETPKVLIARRNDPKKHRIKMPSAANRLLGEREVDRSDCLDQPSCGAFISMFKSQVDIIPVLITLKKTADTESRLAHELTHWMDAVAGEFNTGLSEKRAYFISYHMERVLGSEHHVDQSVALEEFERNKNRGHQTTRLIAARLVAKSVHLGGDQDLSTISQEELREFSFIRAFSGI